MRTTAPASSARARIPVTIDRESARRTPAAVRVHVMRRQRGQHELKKRKRAAHTTLTPPTTYPFLKKRRNPRTPAREMLVAFISLDQEKALRFMWASIVLFGIVFVSGMWIVSGNAIAAPSVHTQRAAFFSVR